MNVAMIAVDAFRDQPVLQWTTVRLEPLTSAVVKDYLRAMGDPEVTRLTGTHAAFDPYDVEDWLRTRQDHHDRADWAIVRSQDGLFLGEAVINDLDADNESASYRLWLAGPDVFGRGYGSEVTRLVVDYALDQVGLHRLSLEVFDHIRGHGGFTRGAGSPWKDGCATPCCGRGAATTPW